MKKFSIFSTLLGLLIISGCGNDNVVDTSQIPSGGPRGGSSGIGTLSNSNLAALYAQAPCSGGARLSEMYFTSSGANVQGSNIRASWQQGTTAGSLVDKSRYIGFSQFNDVMIMEKVTTASGTAAFNLIVSFCQDQNLLVQGRSYSNFATPNGITVADNLNCATNNIISGYATMMADSYGAANPFPVNTLFTVSTNQGNCPF